MSAAIPIVYGEFHDYPRMIQFKLRNEFYFLRSYFDEELDQYSDVYDVYVLPFKSEDDLHTNPNFWVVLNDAIHLGQILVEEVGFDDTRRRSIDAESIELWVQSHKRRSS